MPQREKSGVLRKNDRKEQDKHPDIKGEAMIGGQEYWISGWQKDGKDKEGRPSKFYSLSFTEKEEKRDAPRGGGSTKPPPRTATGRALDDEIPFAPCKD